MRKVILPIFIIFTILSSISYRLEARTDVMKGQVESELLDLADHSKSAGTLAEEMKKKSVPGVSIAFIKDMRINWAEGYGVLEAGTSRGVTTESVFEAASTTKILTSIVVLHLVEKGLVDLDTDINSYLTSWKIPENGFTAKQKVTLRLILTQQSGLNRPDSGISYEEKSKPTLLNVIKGESPSENDAVAVVFTPGSKWQYSNMGYIVLQLLIENVTHKSFSEVVREIIFSPLGMKNSTFQFPLTLPIEKTKAQTHNGEGKACGHGLHPAALAHGGLITTPTDLATLAIELMKTYNGQSQVLFSQKSAKLLFTKAVDLDPSVFGGIEVGMGHGVLLRGTGENLCFFMAGQNLPGTTSIITGFPKIGQGAVIMANGINGELIQLELIGAMGKVYDWPESKLL